MTKLCGKCKEIKPKSAFGKNKVGKDKLQSYCKSCKKQWYALNFDRLTIEAAAKYKNNSEEILLKRKIYRDANREKIRKQARDQYHNNKGTEKGLIRENNAKEYAHKNRDKHRTYAKERYAENRESYKLKSRIYAENNKDKNKKTSKIYVQKNKFKINLYKKIWHNNRLKKDELYYLTNRIRNCISKALRKSDFKKNSKTAEILGCTFEDFKLHIEEQFANGMNWSNHGKWHYDHIIPISSAKNEEEIIKLNHYTNFQPLWAEDNLSKGDNLNWVKCPIKYAKVII